MWKTGDPEMATPERVRTCSPKHSDTSLSREWRINMANKKNAAKFFILFGRVKRQSLAWWSPDVEEAVSERC